MDVDNKRIRLKVRVLESILTFYIQGKYLNLPFLNLMHDYGKIL